MTCDTQTQDTQNGCTDTARRYATLIRRAIEQYRNGVEPEETAFPGLFDPLDIDFTVSYVNGQLVYRGVRLCVAWGGPSAYIDTVSGRAEVFNWGEHGQCELWSNDCDAIDDYYRDLVVGATVEE